MMNWLQNDTTSSNSIAIHTLYNDMTTYPCTQTLEHVLRHQTYIKVKLHIGCDSLVPNDSSKLHTDTITEICLCFAHNVSLNKFNLPNLIKNCGCTSVKAILSPVYTEQWKMSTYWQIWLWYQARKNHPSGPLVPTCVHQLCCKEPCTKYLPMVKMWSQENSDGWISLPQKSALELIFISHPFCDRQRS